MQQKKWIQGATRTMDIGAMHRLSNTPENQTIKLDRETCNLIGKNAAKKGLSRSNLSRKFNFMHNMTKGSNRRSLVRTCQTIAIKSLQRNAKH